MSVIKNKSISLTGNKLYFQENFRKKIIVLTTKMAALLRACEPRIHNTVEPGYNEDLVITEHIWKNYSKICGNEPRYNEPRYNEYILTVPTHNLPPL